MTEDLYHLDGLATSLASTLQELLGDDLPVTPAVELTRPARPEHGDLTTNAAMIVAKRAGRKPREFAEELGERWTRQGGAQVCARFEVAGPGFLNLFLTDEWYGGALRRQLNEGPDFGRDTLPADERQKMNVEFVSVNPTGPLHVGHARYASYGDALCRIFAFAGHNVTREFYVNDHGTQMLRFAQSLAARYGQRLGLETPLPEDGYQGGYLLDLADELIAEIGRRHLHALEEARGAVESLPPAVVDELKTWGRDRILAIFRQTLGRLRISFDVWAHESSLYEGDGRHRGFAGEAGKALADLDGEDLLHEEGGAVWLRTTDYGDDKDRVLIRSTGEPTYFLSDIAYHRDKLDRGFEHMIDVWGADHHGYVPRMKAAFTALPPHDPERLELIIGQLVNLVESGEAKRMSKRKGDIVTIDDLVDAIGVDAARFLLVSRSHDTTLELDLDLAVQQSSQNPVYYVQYAHARICSILRNLGDVAAGAAEGGQPNGWALSEHERALIGAMARWPQVVRMATENRAPHRISVYLGELAAQFHVFYKHCRVLGDDEAVSRFRADLCSGTRCLLATGLGLLGVDAPEQM
jgi:arginyl-tRNA synthetase